MLFNSYGFIFLFLPVTLAGFFICAQRSMRLSAAWITLASLFFYAYWNPPFVLLLIASVAFNFWCGLAIVRAAPSPRKRSTLLAIGVVTNLAVLAFFKYALLLISTYLVFAEVTATLPRIILPLGISFYSFTQIAFLVDAADGKVSEVDPLRYFVFVTYFPHLIAGPVLHHQQVMPQFSRPRTYRWNWNRAALGASMFTLGLAKKVLIADNLAEYADSIFNAIPHGTTPKLFGAWGGAIAYTMQLYFDFSGYCDMAVGLSLLFNVRLPFNFNSPYKATNIIDFWRRWHMTLSQFLRDYLYIRLGGNRHGRVRRYLNLAVTMLLGGLWHGANWTFLAWGGVHGALLIINHAWQRICRRLGWGQLPRGAGVALTFLCVVLAWVLFRADSFATAGLMFHSMIGLSGISLPPVLMHGAEAIGLHPIGDGIFERNIPAYQHLGINRFVVVLTLSLLLAFTGPNTQQLLLCGRRSRMTRWIRYHPRRVGFGMGALFCVTLANLDKVSAFLYYQF